MMLNELQLLIADLPSTTTRSEYQNAIEQDNSLGKPTFSSRRKSFRHLVELYGLDPSFALFRVLRKLCAEDPTSIPLIGMVCAYCRDPQLRHSFSLIESLRPEETLVRTRMEEHLEDGFPEQFSAAMKKSLAQNVNTTWTASGHLVGRSVKKRAIPKPTMPACVYAMFAGWLAGLRGDYLLNSVFARLVAADSSQLIAHLATGSAHGWLRLRHAGGVTEIDFSSLLTSHELENLYVPH